MGYCGDEDWQRNESIEDKLHSDISNIERKLVVATKIMADLIAFKQWVDHVYPDAIKEYDAVMAVGGEVIHKLD